LAGRRRHFRQSAGSPPAKSSYNNIDIDKLVDEAMKGGKRSVLQKVDGGRIRVTGCRTGAAERLVNDAADSTRATAALGATAETAIDLADRARPLRLDGGADILIAQHIARAHDHGAISLDGDLVRL
jgi:hypothetical protein